MFVLFGGDLSEQERAERPFNPYYILSFFLSLIFICPQVFIKFQVRKGIFWHPDISFVSLNHLHSVEMVHNVISTYLFPASKTEFSGWEGADGYFTRQPSIRVISSVQRLNRKVESTRLPVDLLFRIAINGSLLSSVDSITEAQSCGWQAVFERYHFMLAVVSLEHHFSVFDSFDIANTQRLFLVLYRQLITRKCKCTQQNHVYRANFQPECSRKHREKIQ